jgi:hypothetical protein
MIYKNDDSHAVQIMGGSMTLSVSRKRRGREVFFRLATGSEIEAIPIHRQYFGLTMWGGASWLTNDL